MNFSVTPVAKAFKVYQSQDRIAELHKKNPVRSIQNQADTVTISAEARALKSGSSKPPAQSPSITYDKPAVPT